MLILQLQSLATLVVEESECFTVGVDGPLSHTGSMCEKHHLRNEVSYVNSKCIVWYLVPLLQGL